MNINFFKSSTTKLRQAATVAILTIAALSLGSNSPAGAAIFKLAFCGFFNGDTTGNSGQILPGSFITIDTNKTKDLGIVDANIQTTRPSGPTLTYDFSDLQSSGQGTGIPDVDPVFQDGESRFWSFFDVFDNNFNVVIPESVFADLKNVPLDFAFGDNSEIRAGGTIVKDPDKLTVTRVPEPTSILGTTIAIGLGGLLTKNNLRKLNKNTEG